MKPDPAIEAIRKVRHQVSVEFDHDPEKLVRYYIELQKKHQKRLIKSPARPPHKSAA